MKRIALDGKSSVLFARDFDPLRVDVFINAGPDAQSVSRGCAANQIDDDLPANQGTAAPIGSDVAEHAMLDLVPLTGTGRKVTHVDRELYLVGQFLQFALPQPYPVAIAAAAVRRDQQTPRTRITEGSTLIMDTACNDDILSPSFLAHRQLA